MNEKVSPTASNRRKGELAREGDLFTYKRKRKTIDPSTVVPPNTVHSTNEGISEGVNILTESAEGVNIHQGSKFETESAQAGLGAKPPLPNVCPNFDKNIPIFGGYSEGEGVTSSDDVGPSDKSLLRSFRFHRARSIALGQEKLPIRVHHHQSTWDLRNEPQVPETNIFHFKCGEITPTLDDIEQLVRLPADGDVTVIGGTWGFLAILKVFENNLLQDLNVFNFLKAGGAGSSLSLKKLKSHYAYKLEKILSDGTAAAAKMKKGLTARSVAHAYMLYVLGSFLFPMKNRTYVRARYLVLFAKDKVAKKWSWGSAVLAHIYYNLVIYPITIDLAADDSGIHQWKPASVNEHGDTPVHQSKDIAEQYDASYQEHSSRSPNINLNDQQITVLNDQLQKPNENKEKESKANINLREALKEKRQKLANAEERMKSLQANNSEWYKKLVNSEERKKTLEVDNNEWALASEGMGDMGDPTFEELFEQNKRFFKIAQQGPKGDYQEDLVYTAVTLENIVIAGREKMDKKKKMQELLFQPWTKYLVDVRGVEISDNNSAFRVIAAIQHQSQHRFPDVMKSLKTFLCNDPAFWKSIINQTLGIQFTADGENAYQILLQACSYGHQHVKYRHMAHLLATYYEKVVVFISHTEAYKFLPLFWARKRNTTSNDERLQNLVMDTSKYWWFGLGADNHFVRLFPRFDAPIPPLFTIFYSHVNLEIPLSFMKE
ncbi:hypothetical protein GIB67_020836 [Kingdonia uniflora]|uniref:Aminotransferase-like plant mobile domain-containing protein n=1 Tax=Kingdonia uniflora TaxID=39325 RepID=A0A7J7M7A3_9MAGN|nr:hypothetical protein GIB67_020836 [Kingdonia uniflora]